MKLIRKGQTLEESPGLILPDGREADTSSFGEDYDEVFFETDGLERLKSWADENASELPSFPEGERYGSPIARPSKIVCIGLNYVITPRSRVWRFPKSRHLLQSLCLLRPQRRLDPSPQREQNGLGSRTGLRHWQESRYAEEANALDHLAGYALHNDYSERAFQLEHCGQW